MTEEAGYRVGEQPRRYGCRDYSLEMQLLQLQKRAEQVSEEKELKILRRRIAEIEQQLGM